MTKLQSRIKKLEYPPLHSQLLNQLTIMQCVPTCKRSENIAQCILKHLLNVKMVVGSFPGWEVPKFFYK